MSGPDIGSGSLWHAGEDPPDQYTGNGEEAADMTAIARLAELDPIVYDRVRVAEARRLGCRVATLDRLVGAVRNATSPDAPSAPDGDATLPEVEPWPEPVDLAAVLEDLISAILLYVAMPHATAVAVALWIAHTWAYEAFRHTPRLAVTSAVRGCGKSTLLALLLLVCRRALKADNLRASGVYRLVEALSPLTLLIDEADSFLPRDEELRGVLNSGFEAGGAVVRSVQRGGRWEPERLETFAPVALAAIGGLPPTLAGRALPIPLERRGPGEAVRRLRDPGAREDLEALGRRLARWAADEGGRLPPDPLVPEALGDREADVSVPLLAVADAAGGRWPARARAALLEVFGARAAAEADADVGVLLLGDVRAIFGEAAATRLASGEICAWLAGMEERPWPEFRRGRPITPTQLAAALHPFGIGPTTIRPGPGAEAGVPRKGEPKKGYHAAAFREAWARYLPPPPADGPVPDADGASPPLGKRAEAAAGPSCNGVTARTPPVRAGEDGPGTGGDDAACH
jgi:uncharacterized protein DUF3631